MKKIFMIGMLAVIMLASMVMLSAEKLKFDVNGIAIQLPRYMTAIRDTIPAQAPAVYDSLAVPANAVEVTLIFTTQPGMIYTGPAKTLTATAADWLIIPKETPITLPVMDVITYIKYKSLTGANAVNIIWRRM